MVRLATYAALAAQVPSCQDAALLMGFDRDKLKAALGALAHQMGMVFESLGHSRAADGAAKVVGDPAPAAPAAKPADQTAAERPFGTAGFKPRG